VVGKTRQENITGGRNVCSKRKRRQEKTREEKKKAQKKHEGRKCEKIFLKKNNKNQTGEIGKNKRQ